MTSGRPHRLRRICLLASLLLAIFATGLLTRGVFSQSRDIVTLAAYQARLEQARAQIATAQSAGAQQAVEQAAADLYAISGVLLPDNRRVDLEPLVLMSNTPAAALAHIDAVLAQLWAAASDNAAERFAALDRVMASREMNPGGGLLGWLRRLLGGLVGEPSGDVISEGFRVIDTVVTVVAALVLVFILGRILQAALGNFMREADVRREGAAGERVTVVSARRRAADLAQAGSYREAVRQLYLATLLGLEERGLLRVDRSLTNREVLTGVAQWRDVQSGLRPVIDTFETVWYGEREPDLETFERYSVEVESAADLIERAAPRPTAPLPMTSTSTVDAA